MKSVYICLKNPDALTGERTVAFSDVLSVHCNHTVLRVYRFLPEDCQVSPEKNDTVTDTFEMSDVLYFDAE